MPQSRPEPSSSKLSTFLSRFTRVTSSGRYMPEIDGLRFVAIMAVILYHSHVFFFAKPIPDSICSPISWDWLNYAMGHGWFGVQVFFVISGFVLALPFASQHLEGKRAVDLKNYYSRRVVRIGFPYIIALTAGLITSLALGMQFSEALRCYALGLIYSYSAFSDGLLNPILYVSWTLEIEIQFYLLAPLLGKVFALRSSWARISTLVISMFAICLLSDELSRWLSTELRAHSILGQLQFFLAGLLLAEFYISYWKHRSSRAEVRCIWDFVGICAWLFIPFSLHLEGFSHWRAFLVLLAFSCVLKGSLLKRILSFRLFSTIGGMCYSIYLFHGACLEIFVRHVFALFIEESTGVWPRNLFLLGILTTMTILTCCLAYYFIERPSMMWGSKKKNEQDHIT